MLPAQESDGYLMEKNILFICTAKSFMVNAIINNLEKEGCKVTWSKPKVTEVSRLESDVNIFLAYLDSEDNNGFPETLTYLKDYIVESSRTILLYLIGTQDEINAATLAMQGHGVTGSFLRPINVKELVEQLNEKLEDASLSAPKKHILVVDDDPTMLGAIRGWLEGKYQVYLANSGMNAISLLARHQIDLVLLDYEMPVITGAKVLEMIRSEPLTSSMPVMFLTSKSDRESVMEVVSLKPEKYLLKTMSPDELIANIDEFFEKQKAKESLV